MLITDFTLETLCISKIGFSKSSQQSSQSQNQRGEKHAYDELRLKNSKNFLNLEGALSFIKHICAFITFT